MHRLYVISICALGILSGCSSLHVNLRQAGPEAWGTEGSSPARSNAVEATLEPPLEERWAFNAGAGFGSVSPLVIENVVLVGTRKGEVHAINLETGKRLGQASFGETIEGTPAFHEGILYIPVGWGRSALLAYDMRRGETRWKVKGAPIGNGLVLWEDRIIAADDVGGITAYSLDAGKTIWATRVGEKVGIKSTPALVGDHLFVGDDAGHVTAIDVADGSLIWSILLDGPIYSSLAADRKRVYVATTRGRLFALDAEEGHVVWSFDVENENVYLSAAAVGSEVIVFGGSDGRVRALASEDGAVQWTSEAGAAVTAPPLITGGTVYVGTMRNRLAAFALSDGEKTWETKLEGRVKSAFAALGARIVVLAEPRTVHLFETKADSYALTGE